MKNYNEIFLFHDHNNEQINIELVKILSCFPELTILRSWENGYHTKIIGKIKENSFIELKIRLQTMIDNHSTFYNEEEFREKYKKISIFLKKEEFLEEILQNKIIINPENGRYADNFQNEEQLSMYLRIHYTFDDHYKDNYFKNNSIYEIIGDLIPFCASLPDKVIVKNPILESNGYISHLSHYLGFHNSLNEKSSDIVKTEFENHYLNLMEEDFINLNPDFNNKINLLFTDFASLVNLKKVNFFTPYDYEELKLRYQFSSNYHKPILFNKELRDAIFYDKVLCWNKFVLNVFYEKLILLGILPKDKFFINYFIARERYKIEEFEVGGRNVH